MTFTNKKANTWSNITVLWHLLQQQKRKKNKKKIGATIGCSSDWIVQKICKYYTDRLFSHEELSKKNCPHWKCPFSFYTEFKEPWTSCKCKTWTAVRHKKTANWQKKTSWKTRNIITCVGQADANYGKKIKYSFGTFKLVTNQPEA